MKLTPVQKEILLTLIDLYRKSEGGAIKGEEIAEVINRNPGTVRNQMQFLRSMGLVEGVPGPKGGYKPTAEGYKALDFEKIKKEVEVPIKINDKPFKEISVASISFTDIPDPEKCQASLHVIGNIRKVNIGSIIEVGPTPINKLVIKGKVIARDDIDNVIVIETLEIISVPREKIKDLATVKIKSLPPGISVREAAKILVREKIRGAPVVRDGIPIGIVSTYDITKAVAQGKENAVVEEMMNKNVVTIDEEAYLFLAIDRMNKENISRLIVVDDEGKVKGIITRTDILARIGKVITFGESYSNR